ncbi:hypothetical protein U9M48_021517 [Paspalum notatum var. saurae]|uniref:MYB-CC type transcription factor LHEQLE-containing domain-containing protein n=1 Tax=Paspalum notatum var. saurae TaxID=547442 RepID=A0AAQ3THI3_PASNO
MLQEITREDHRAPVLRVDNQSAIELAKNPVLHDRSKHIDIRFHFIRDGVTGGRIILGHVGTGQQLADILTKPLGQKRLVQLMVKIGVEEIKHEDQASVPGMRSSQADEVSIPQLKGTGDVEGLMAQIGLQKQLHEQLEIQRKLQMQVEEHSKYLEMIIVKQSESLKNLGALPGFQDR